MQLSCPSSRRGQVRSHSNHTRERFFGCRFKNPEGLRHNDECSLASVFSNILCVLASQHQVLFAYRLHTPSSYVCGAPCHAVSPCWCAWMTPNRHPFVFCLGLSRTKTPRVSIKSVLPTDLTHHHHLCQGPHPACFHHPGMFRLPRTGTPSWSFVLSPRA